MYDIRFEEGQALNLSRPFDVTFLFDNLPNSLSLKLLVAYF